MSRRNRTTGDETHRRVVVVDDVPPLAGGFRRRPTRGADPAGASEQSRHGCRRGRHRVERIDERVFSSSVVLSSDFRVTRTRLPRFWPVVRIS